MNNIFDGIKKVHLIGVGGIGMSGIAEYLGRKKYEVTGSDLAITPVTRRLEKFKVKTFEGHDEKNLPDNTELVIYSAAVNEDNPEYLKAKSLGIRMVKRAEALGNIVNDKFVISVSGTHGKTTTTAMIAKVLIESKLDPTVFVGGNIDYLDGGSSRIGKSNIAVVEADEYDRSFLQLKSDIIVITNIDLDHLDIYRDIDDIKDSFRNFIAKGKKGLQIIACGDEKNVVDVLKDRKDKILYGFSKVNDFTIKNISYGKTSIGFTLGMDDLKIVVPGKHNIFNAAAAYLTTKKFNVSEEKFNQSFETFYGVKRRLELKYHNGVKIYDDYAHHPTEVLASLEAVKNSNPKRVITVFQPHLFSRTRDLYKEFGAAFSETDILILDKIYPAREKEIKGVSSEMILGEYNGNIAKQKTSARNKVKEQGLYFDSKEMIMDELDKISRDGDVIIFQGAGDITELCSQYIKRIKIKSNWTVPL
ncbi:MAG TPA: UDP-N-acetylmuramate--L-alanine ligase [Ignavibacteria bacterium]|nr:UDP-N-acetylmuramate--L-alanine ligase [Ignavibacteria bacterium]